MIGIFRRKERKDALEKLEWPDHVLSLNDRDFDDFIGKYPLSLVDFWAPWCKPCNAMIPRMRRLSKIYAGKVAFARINIEENKEVSRRYRIASIPQLIFFGYGKKIREVSGLKSVGEIKKIIDRLMDK